MKKRIASLLLAVLMILATVSTVAAAADDAGIMPLVPGCPRCQNGLLHTVKLSSEKIYGDRALCSCWDKYPQEAKYNCRTYQMETVYAERCDNCKSTFRTWTDTGPLRQEHDACKGSGCGH